jgi:prepilin-type processing-associated H-X9-DG protein
VRSTKEHNENLVSHLLLNKRNFWIADLKNSFIIFKHIKKFHTKSTFTIIELLVVIAIMTIMASLLLPALRTAKEKTKQISCISNMKQMTKGLFLYSSDFNGLFPESYSSGNFWYEKYWHWKIKGYLNSNFDHSMKPYYHDTVFMCQSDNDTVNNPATSYIYVALFYPDYTIYSKKILNPSSTGIITDGCGQIASPTQLIADAGEVFDTDRRLRSRHNFNVNILFCDGHTSSKKVNIGQSIQTIFQAY